MERRLLRHWVRFADSRARLNVGRRIEISTAMMPMTTSNSTKVKAKRRRGEGDSSAMQTSGKPRDACPRPHDRDLLKDEQIPSEFVARRNCIQLLFSSHKQNLRF